MESPGRRSSSLSFTRKLQETLESAGLEAAVGHRHSHRTADFLPMTAISEATFCRQRVDIGEGSFRTSFDGAELRFAHARSVNEPGATGASKQRPCCRRVPSLAVVLTNLPCLLHVRAEQRIDQGRLAHAGGPDKCDGLAFPQPRRQRRKSPNGIQCVHGDDREAFPDALRGGHIEVGIRANVGLRQDDHGGDSRLMRAPAASSVAGRRYQARAGPQPLVPSTIPWFWAGAFRLYILNACQSKRRCNSTKDSGSMVS